MKRHTHAWHNLLLLLYCCCCCCFAGGIIRCIIERNIPLRSSQNFAETIKLQDVLLDATADLNTFSQYIQIFYPEISLIDRVTRRTVFSNTHCELSSQKVFKWLRSFLKFQHKTSTAGRMRIHFHDLSTYGTRHIRQDRYFPMKTQLHLYSLCTRNFLLENYKRKHLPLLYIVSIYIYIFFIFFIFYIFGTDTKS